MAEELKNQLKDSVLAQLDEKGPIANSLEFLATLGHPESEHDTLISAMRSLASWNYVVMNAVEHKAWVLTPEAESYVAKGSPEAQVYDAVPEGGVPQKELMAKLGEVAKIGFPQAMKRRWISSNKEGMVTKLVATIDDESRKQLQHIRDNKGAGTEEKVLNDLKKRKLATINTYKTYSVEKGLLFSRQQKKFATDLTMEMMKGDEWKSQEFKEYNFNAMGPVLESGCLHPLMKIRAEFRSILLEMGFSEMPTNNYVESSFWNFDALFQPQQHPARDAHDTFFLKTPAACRSVPEEYCQRVQATHEKGGYGSIGYRYDWKLAEAQKNLLRTHTTAVSSRMLYALAQEKPFKPQRYFSIDRVFRNETLDATHLAEFHQVEGLIADRNLSLGDLIGVIETFFRRIGHSDVRFKPAYNPYTEPSMEIFGYSKQLGRWIEVGNSGIFRPEMLRPMGLPEDVTVIAWGLSLERPTMIKYGIRNIRELFGPKVRLDKLGKNPIARYD